jgi:hypothetical protein
MRSLGWADFLHVNITNNRNGLIASYWMLVGILVDVVEF